MSTILLSAFACDPSKGSEPGNGWNWSEGLVKRGFTVHCLTRINGKSSIDNKNNYRNLYFHYIKLPYGLERLYTKGTIGMYLYYLLWQWWSYRRALSLKKDINFKLVQHVTWGSLQMGSFMYKLNIPFIFGPSGGGQAAPVKFSNYFLDQWKTEERREHVANLMFKYNPAFRKMLKRATAILVSNKETMDLATKAGAKNVHLILDAALPDYFYPENFLPKQSCVGKLKLLWVGRFMPRKGLLLLLDVMNKLKDNPAITLTIIGDGEMRPFVEKRIEDYKLHETVFLKGQIPFGEVRHSYATHEVFFFTSLRDSCPAQLIEAMAFGLPVITLDLHGQSLIVNERNGIKCNCDDPESTIVELRNAILTLANSPETVRKMSKEAHDFALMQNWDNKIESIVDDFYKI